MTNKITAVLLIITCLLGMTINANAASFITEKNFDTNEITISGTIQEAVFNQTIFIEVLDEEQVPAQMAPISTDQNGAFSYKFKMSSATRSGNYTLRIGTYDKASPFTETFYFSNSVEIKNLLQSISNMDALQIKETLTPYNIRVLNLENEFFTEFPLAVCRKIAENEPYDSTLGVQNAAFPEIAVQALRIANDLLTVDKILETYQQYMKLQDQRLYSKYALLSNVQKDTVKSGFIKSPYNNLEDIRNKFNEAVVFELLAATEKYNDVTEIFEEYQDLLGIDLNSTRYKSLREPGNVSAEFVGGRYTSVDNFSKAFNDAVDQQLDYQSPKVNNVHSGGKGQTITTNSVSIPLLLPTPSPVQAITEDYKDKSEIELLTWAAASIKNMSEKGIISGDSEGNFRPNAPITRGEFVKIIVNSLGLADSAEKLDFKDVSSEDWYYRYLASAQKAGIISGQGDGSFGAGEQITRQDLAVMLYRAAAYVSNNISAIKEEKKFSDNTLIAPYALESIKALQMAGIINGMDDGSFAPHHNATRAEACVMTNALLFGGAAQ